MCKLSGTMQQIEKVMQAGKYVQNYFSISLAERPQAVQSLQNGLNPLQAH